MDKHRIILLLNQSVSRELGAIIQYMWQHVLAKGMASPEIVELFKDTALEEMKHAHAFAERIDQLGGAPTVKMHNVMTGVSLVEMVESNRMIEQEAIDLYNEAIGVCREEGDSTTRLLFEKILLEEEGHFRHWRNILSD